ncbi:MAG TPA: metal ABC transporter permease, partial [Parvularcula sp.]|nr:metal ABC transporter permease [Parvularcula sp.]
MKPFDEVALKPQNFSAVIARMIGILRRPALARWRPRMALALVVTLVSKLLAVGAPVLLGDGINRVAAGQAVGVAAPSFAAFFILFAVARFLSNGLPQLRDAFFARVTQEANRSAAVEAFGHAQAQALQFHLMRRAGAVNRIIERGAGAIEFLLRFLAFNIGPTLVELALAAAVMATLYSWKLAAAAVVTILAYIVFTVLITERRNVERRLMN